MPGGIHPPPSVIASWPKANLEHPHTRGWELVALTITLYSLALFAVVARLWARLVIQKNPGLDDALIVVSLVVALAMVISVCLASKQYGHDRHVWDVYIPTFVQSRSITFAAEFCYVLSTTLTRLSILCFYRRMSRGTFSMNFIWSVRLTIAFVIAYGITFEMTLIFGCSPVIAFWQQVDLVWLADHTYHCINEGATLLAASIVSLVQDLLTCLLPTLLFWKLRLPKRQKVALGSIFGVGGFLCITAILRIYYIHQIFYVTYDTTWEAQNSWLWTSIETLLGIVCASAPALKVFFEHYFSASNLRNSSDYMESRPSSTLPFNRNANDRVFGSSKRDIGPARPHKLHALDAEIGISAYSVHEPR